MTQIDPLKRLNLQDILNHPWIKGPIIGQNEIEIEMKSRMQKVDTIIELDRNAKLDSKESKLNDFMELTSIKDSIHFEKMNKETFQDIEIKCQDINSKLKLRKARRNSDEFNKNKSKVLCEHNIEKKEQGSRGDYS